MSKEATSEHPSVLARSHFQGGINEHRSCSIHSILLRPETTYTLETGPPSPLNSFKSNSELEKASYASFPIFVFLEIWKCVTRKVVLQIKVIISACYTMVQLARLCMPRGRVLVTPEAFKRNPRARQVLQLHCSLALAVKCSLSSPPLPHYPSSSGDGGGVGCGNKNKDESRPASSN